MGQNEDCSPGNRSSDSSEKLLQRGRGEGQYIGDLGEGETHAIKHIFFFLQKASATLMKVSASVMKVSPSHEEQSSP